MDNLHALRDRATAAASAIYRLPDGDRRREAMRAALDTANQTLIALDGEIDAISDGAIVASIADYLIAVPGAAPAFARAAAGYSVDAIDMALRNRRRIAL